MGDSKQESQQSSDGKEKRPAVIVEDLPKHMRRRYWSSWEELKLLELYRRYFDDITTLLRNMPIFTSISADMRSYGFQVNPQECRRKINNLRNKYLSERRNLESSGKAESEWRLYPIVHCILEQLEVQKLKVDKYHERNTLKALLAKLPPLPSKPALETTASLPTKPSLQSIQTKSKAPLLQNEIVNNANQNGFVKPLPVRTVAATTSTMRAPYRRAYRSANSISVNNKAAPLNTSSTKRVTPYRTAKTRDNRLLRQHFNLSRLQELKQDNLRLAERRDFELKRLCIEERELKMLENVVHTLQCGGD